MPFFLAYCSTVLPCASNPDSVQDANNDRLIEGDGRQEPSCVRKHDECQGLRVPVVIQPAFTATLLLESLVFDSRAVLTVAVGVVAAEELASVKSTIMTT